MEFLQEPTFTALLAIVLTFVVAKIVTFAVSNSNSGGCSVREVGRDVGLDRELRVGLDRELRVKRSKGGNRVKFVDDVVIRRIDRFEGTENIESSDDVMSVNFEKSGGRVEESSEVCGERKGEEEEREGRDCDSESKGSEKVEMPIEETGKGLIVEEEKIGVEIDGDNAITDEKGGTGGTGIGESGAVFTGEDEDDDDWEGIERSELEKVFAEAVNYVEYGGKGKEKEDDRLAKLSSDVQMELYGLHKLAVEGPCAEPSPMALKVSARARWNAWQRLGSMNQEAAMEQYIRLLTDSIPGWMLDYSAEDSIQKQVETVSDAEHERKSELSAIPVGDSSMGQSCVEKDDVV